MLSIVLHIAGSHIVSYPKFWDFKDLLCEGKTTCFLLKIIFYADQGLVSDLTNQVIVIPFILQPFERSIVPLSATCSLYMARYKFDFSEELVQEMLPNMFRRKGSCVQVGWTVTLHTVLIPDFQVSSIFPWREGLGYAKYLIVTFRIMDSHVLLVLHK